MCRVNSFATFFAMSILVSATAYATNNDKQIIISPKPHSQANSASTPDEAERETQTFDTFLSEFSGLVKTNNWEGIADVTDFPLTIRGELDDDGSVEIDRERFLKLIGGFFQEEVYLTINDELVASTYRNAMINSIDKPEINGDTAELHGFHFAIKNQHWKLKQITTYVHVVEKLARDDKTKASRKNRPVSWDTGFTMSSLLAVSGVTLNSINDLPKLIDAPWYDEIAVTKTKVGETALSSCHDYFTKADDTTHAAKENEIGAYLELKIMCEATRLLMNAKESKKSFLPNDVLSKTAPQLWPKAMALQISTEESKRSAENPKLTSLNDVTPVIKYESQSNSRATYFHNGGYQEVEILGRGDANNDGIEDIFLVLRDHVNGGDYFNIRLFVLSVDSKAGWHLIKEIGHPEI